MTNTYDTQHKSYSILNSNIFPFLGPLNEELSTQAVIANRTRGGRVIFADLYVIKWNNWSCDEKNDSKVERYEKARREKCVDLEYLVGGEVSFWAGIIRKDSKPIRFGNLSLNKDGPSSTVQVFNKQGLPINPQCVYDLLMKYAMPAE